MKRTECQSNGRGSSSQKVLCASAGDGGMCVNARRTNEIISDPWGTICAYLVFVIHF